MTPPTARTIFDTETHTGYVCLADLLKAMGSTTNPAQVIPEIKEALGDGVLIVFPIPDALIDLVKSAQYP